MSTDSYLLDNSAPTAGTRFDALSALFDGVTMRHVDGIGVAAGWRCWEVGAGGPGVPSLLAERVGPTGYVVATDLDVGQMSTNLPGNVEVRRHDVATDEPPGSGFDLVHARLVLVHVPQRDEALRRIVAALRPGGWLLIEDFDVSLQPLACVEARGEAEHRANRVRGGFVELLAQRGVDLAYGRTPAAAAAGGGPHRGRRRRVCAGGAARRRGSRDRQRPAGRSSADQPGPRNRRGGRRPPQGGRRRTARYRDPTPGVRMGPATVTRPESHGGLGRSRHRGARAGVARCLCAGARLARRVRHRRHPARADSGP
jgi:SAM-dependent methyltransferase